METGFVQLLKIFRLISCNEIGPGKYFGYKYLGCIQNSPESPKTGRSTAHIMNPPTLRQLQRGTRGICRYCLPASSHRNLPAAPHQDNSLWLRHLKEFDHLTNYCEIQLLEREGGHLGNGQESQTEADKVLSRLIKQNSEKRAEKIPDLIRERKKGKIAYFILDRLIVREKNEGKG